MKKLEVMVEKVARAGGRSVWKRRTFIRTVRVTLGGINHSSRSRTRLVLATNDQSDQTFHFRLACVILHCYQL